MKSIKTLLLILNVLFIVLASVHTEAQTSTSTKKTSIVVSADEMNADLKKKITNLKGNVQVVFRGQHLTCDEAVIDYIQQTIEASGRIQIINENSVVEASHIKLNYETDSAVITGGYIQSGNVAFEGDEIRRDGPNKFTAINGRYTACISCPPAWSFSGKEIEAELGGYAKISRPVLRVGGVPVFILPGILVPLKSKRQTGFLVPSLNYSRSGGAAFSQSFFWAIDSSQDMTLSAKYYELRGVKGLLEHRYALTENSRGEFQSAIMKDRASRKEFRVSQDVSRWFYKYQHIYDLPGRYTQRVSLKQISDLRYLRDFPDELEGHGDAALENKVSLTKTTPNIFASIEVLHHLNLLKSSPLAPNDDAVHRFPELRLHLLERKLPNTPILFRFDGDYNYFTRMRYAYDDMTETSGCHGLSYCAGISNNSVAKRDGQFDTAPDGSRRDLIRTGQRLDLRPTLSLPFRMFEFLDILPLMTYRETQYRFQIEDVAGDQNYGPAASQRYIETELSAKTTLARVYGNLEEARGRRTKHEIEPKVTLSTRPWIHRSDHAFFGEFAGQKYSRHEIPISDADVYDKNGLQFDYNDRIFDQRVVDFALTNRLIRKIWNSDSPDYNQIVSFRISRSYDFYEAETSKPQPWSPIHGILNVRLKNFETYTDITHNTYAHSTNTSTRLRLIHDYGHYIQGSYEKIILVNDENEVINPNQTENIGGGIGYNSPYFDVQGQVDYSAISKKIQSWQYITSLKPPGECWVIQLVHKQVVGGDPEIRFNMSFDFGGDQIKKKPLL